MLSPLYFLHIPKTAGTSLNSWLSTKFAWRQVFPHVDAAKVALLPDEDLQGYQYYSGHFGISFVDRLDVRPRVVTWLREPARRLLSSYHYLRTLDEATQRELTHPVARAQFEAARVMCFDDWLRLPNDEYAIHNHMVHSLVGLEVPPGDVTALACRNLESLDHFGIVERMQESIDLLCYRLRWLPEDFEIALNSGAHNERISSETMEFIKECSAQDVALYDYAKSLFDRRLDEMRRTLAIGAGDKRERELGALHSWFREANPKFEAPRLGWFSAEDARVHYGWFRLVRNEGAGDALTRWSGPGPHSELFLNLPRGHALYISVSILNVMDADVLRSLELEVNGVDVPLRSEPDPQEHYPYAQRFYGIVAACVLQAEPGLTRFVFHISQTFAVRVAREPRDAPMSLGFEFGGIDVRLKAPAQV